MNSNKNTLPKYAPFAIAAALGLAACGSHEAPPNPPKPETTAQKVIADAVKTFQNQAGDKAELQPLKGPLLDGLYEGIVAISVPNDNRKIKVDLVGTEAKPTAQNVITVDTTVTDKYNGKALNNYEVSLQHDGYKYSTLDLIRRSSGYSRATVVAFDAGKRACAAIDVRWPDCPKEARPQAYQDIRTTTLNEMEDSIGAVNHTKEIKDALDWHLPDVEAQLWNTTPPVDDQVIHRFTLTQDGARLNV